MNQVQSMLKTSQDNDVADHIDLVYTEIETQLLGPIRLGVVCDENQIGQLYDRLDRCGLRWKWN